MIASDRRAVKVGTSLLVVDGADQTLNRKAELSLRPARHQGRSLRRLVRFSREYYNAALEHRRTAYRMAGASISRVDQFNEIPAIREIRPEMERYGSQWIRGSISRVDEGDRYG